MPDWVLPRLAIEMALAVDVDVELKSDSAIEAHEDHTIRYRSSRVNTAPKTFTRAPLRGYEWGF